MKQLQFDQLTSHFQVCFLSLYLYMHETGFIIP